MVFPSSEQHNVSVTYDRARGVVRIANQQPVAPAASWREYTSPADLAAVLAQEIEQHRPLLARLAAYGLALAARTHAGWPTDAKRAALIQAAELLRQSAPSDIEMQPVLDAALQVADSALLHGEDAEMALVHAGDMQPGGNASA
jgi:methylthioribose-1-phosphate isomerase